MKRVELIESWTDEEGEWRILYYVVSAGGTYVISDFERIRWNVHFTISMT